MAMKFAKQQIAASAAAKSAETRRKQKGGERACWFCIGVSLQRRRSEEGASHSLQTATIATVSKGTVSAKLNRTTDTSLTGWRRKRKRQQKRRRREGPAGTQHGTRD